MSHVKNVSSWPLIVGVAFMAVSVVFFMTLVVIAVLMEKEVPYDSRFLVVIILSLTTSVGSGFLGGYAKASGNISLPFLDTPLTFGITGGIAVFFLAMIFGHVLYSGASAGPNPSFEAFQKYKEDYREKYEDLHNDLDVTVILPKVNEIKSMSYEEYSDYIVSTINLSKTKHVAFSAVANFYEGLLRCEKNNGLGCEMSEIDKVFSDEVSNFWFTYRPYFSYLRKNGYDKLGILVEKKALNMNHGSI